MRDMKTIRTLKISPDAPDTNSVWLYKGTMRYFNNGEWETAGGDPEPYVLPKATAGEIGGVRQAANVGDLAAGAELEAVVAKVNAILSALKAADIMVGDSN